MATKKQTGLENIFSKTETGPAQPADEIEDNVKSVGIGLRSSEWKRLEEIAAEMGVNRHALALWVIRDFLRRYERGEIQTTTKKSLPGL